MNYLEKYGDANFSENFVGDIDVYTGYKDEMLNFAGAQSFADEMQAGRIFVMNFDSTLPAAKKVVLLPSFASKLKGRTVIANGIVYADKADPTKDLKAVGSPSRIQELHAFLKSVPSNLIGMRVSSTNTDQLQQIMTVEEHSPFSQEKSKEIFLGTHISENSLKDNMVTFATPNVVLGDETEISLNILPGKTTITFFVGAVLSTSSALRVKTKNAVSNIKQLR